MYAKFLASTVVVSSSLRIAPVLFFLLFHFLTRSLQQLCFVSTPTSGNLRNDEDDDARGEWKVFGWSGGVWSFIVTDLQPSPVKASIMRPSYEQIVVHRIFGSSANKNAITTRLQRNYPLSTTNSNRIINNLRYKTFEGSFERRYSLGARSRQL